MDENGGDELPLPLGFKLENTLFDSRRIFIYGEITQKLARDVTQKMIAMSELSEDEIVIFINSQGLGHFALKKYWVAAILASTACASLYVLLAQTVALAQRIVDRIQSGEVAADIGTIVELFTEQAEGADMPSVEIATTAIVVSWLIGIFDSYRIGRKKDKMNRESESS